MISFEPDPPSDRPASAPEENAGKNLLVEMVKGLEKRPYHSRELRDDFDSEDDLLEYELSYRPPRHDTRFFKTNPAGFNVIRSMGAMFALGGWVCTVLVMSWFVDIRGMGSVPAESPLHPSLKQG